jgi:hypothetical protein
MVDRRFRGVLALLLAALLWAPIASAAPYESTRWLYRIDLPDDWKQLPDEQVQSMLSAARAGGARPAVVFDAGFCPASPGWTFDGPYVLVQVVRYSGLSIYHPVEQNDFDNVMRLMIGSTGMRGAAADPSQQNGAPAPTARVGEPSLDKSGRRYTVETEVEVAGRGKFRGVLTGYFARDQLVQVGYYAPAATMDLAAAKRITQSLRFVEPKPVVATTVAPAPGAGRAAGSGAGPTPAGKYVLQNAIDRAVDGAILGGGIGAITAFKAYRNKRRKGKDGDATSAAE